MHRYLARDIQTGLKQFLVSGFEPADAFMHGLMSRFAEDETAWLKGPYVQISLPFVKMVALDRRGSVLACLE